MSYMNLRSRRESNPRPPLGASGAPTDREVSVVYATGESKSGQGISARGAMGSRTPLFGELPDVSAYFATDHEFDIRGKSVCDIYESQSMESTDFATGCQEI